MLILPYDVSREWVAEYLTLELGDAADVRVGGRHAHLQNRIESIN